MVILSLENLCSALLTQPCLFQFTLVVHTLTLFCIGNTFYTFYRKRHYRLFESSIDQTPVTPSARRVRVDSSPVTSSPLRYLTNAISSGSAESRAHPDAHRDVWELAIWDPLPICIRIFSLFSPGHLLVYWNFVPTQLSDPRPSVTIVACVFLTTLLSVQMSFLCSFFTRQAKDSTLVHKEVLKEYDTKYVHPRTQPLMRDVGAQFSEADATQSGADSKYNKVDTFTPTFIIKRGFKTNPNPNYVKHVDPEGQSTRRDPFGSPDLFHQHAPMQTPSHLHDGSPSLRSQGISVRQPQFRPTSTSAGDGGSLGVFSHANSPLRKSTSANFDRRIQNSGDFYYRERGTSPLKKQSSPLKRSIVPGDGSPTTPRSNLNYANTPSGMRRF